MAIYYVKYRKTGPTAVFSVIANNRESRHRAGDGSSAAAGEEFAIWDANTGGFMPYQCNRSYRTVWRDR